MVISYSKFALFKSIFLRNLSLSNARWFYGKKRKIGKRNLYLSENRLSRNKILYAANNHNYMYHIMCKRIFAHNVIHIIVSHYVQKNF